MEELEKLKETLEPMHDMAVAGEFPKDRYAIQLTQQQRVNAWKFLIKTKKHRTPNEQELQESYSGAIHDTFDARLEANENRDVAEIAQVMGEVKESWSVDEMFEVIKAVRGQSSATATALQKEERKYRELDTIANRYKAERNSGRQEIDQLKKQVKDLENQAAEESMADASLEDQVTELVSALSISP